MLEPDTSPVSLVALLERRAREIPDRPFVVDDCGASFTYGEMHQRSLLWADVLRALGTERGDRILTMVPNSAEALALWLGCTWLGAVEVPVHNELRGGVLQHVISLSDPSLMIVAPHLMERVVEAIPEERDRRLLVEFDLCARDQRRPSSVSRANRSATALLAEAQPSAGLRLPSDHDIACVLFTSGTTGPSKGVLLPWRNLHASGLGSLPVEDLSSEDVWYGPGSASHVGAKSLPFLFAMVGGRVVLRERFSTSQFWSDIRRFGVTSTVLVGSMAHYLYLQEPRPDDADTSLRNILMVPVLAQHREFNRRFGTRIYTVFNQTEISVPVTSDGWEIRDWRSAGRLRRGYPGYEVRLVDEYDHEVSPGAVGEMLVRTDVPWALNAGYLDMPERTVKAWRNGWFHTGDLFRMSPEGDFFFVDRAKDALRVGGENVSSAELEAEVTEHPSVQECAAVAVAAEYSEDDIMVYAVPRDGCELDPEDLIEFLVTRLARYMVPRYIEIIDELPKNSRLRVRKDQLRLRGVGEQTWDRVAKGMDIPRD